MIFVLYKYFISKCLALLVSECMINRAKAAKYIKSVAMVYFLF
jgi:hypothetical protein